MHIHNCFGIGEYVEEDSMYQVTLQFMEGGTIVAYPAPEKHVTEEYLFGKGWHPDLIRAGITSFLDAEGTDEDDPLHGDRIKRIADRFIKIATTPRKTERWLIVQKKIACSDDKTFAQALATARESVKKIEAMRREGINFGYGPMRGLPSMPAVVGDYEPLGEGLADFSAGA